MEIFPARISTSKKSNIFQKLKKWAKSSDDWQILHGDYLSEENSKTRQLERTSPRRRHSISGSKESVEHLIMRNKREVIDSSKPINSRLSSFDSVDS